jgi:transposase-like protein
MTFFEFLEQFPTEHAIVDHWIKIRYNDKPVCSHCGSETYVYHRNDKIKQFQCQNCHNSFSVFTGSIFEKSCTDLRKWFYAIHLFLNGKKGISGLQLKREIGVTYKTAWRMLQQIRKAMGNKENDKFFEAIVEIDETYVGGKPRGTKKQDDDDQNKRGRGTKKTPVVGIVKCKLPESD